jgi:hypothetical protein
MPAHLRQAVGVALFLLREACTLMRTTSSGLLLLLIGVIALSAFVNGALPSLLDTLFSSGGPSPATSGTAALVPAAVRPVPTVGTAATRQVA